ncbi:MAG: PEGA domain-containing protein [Candidatus Acidiferrales bacterium]
MQPSWRLCICASFALFLCFAAPRTSAKNLTITTSPPGARLEINGLFVGTTPYTSDYPGGYFHKPHTVFGSRLDRAMVLTISEDGYLPEKVIITKGPLAWVSINGRHHGNYFLLKATHFEIRLQPVSSGNGQALQTIDGEGPMRPVKSADRDASESNPRSKMGTVAISSNPTEAEIYVDGQFEGQTPAKLRLASGLHHFLIQFSGDKNEKKWERDLDVLAGSNLTLNASASDSP